MSSDGRLATSELESRARGNTHGTKAAIRKLDEEPLGDSEKATCRTTVGNIIFLASDRSRRPFFEGGRNMTPTVLSDGRVSSAAPISW